MGRTSIIVVTYNHRALIGDCLRALDRAGLSPAEVRVLLVDNASSDGTAAHIRDELLTPDGQRTRGGLPARLWANDQNLGFAGGNNLAIRQALADGDELVYLLNPDTEVEPGFLAQAIAVARSDDKIAFVQSLLLRHDDPAVVNSYGNALHFLGFGYAAGDGLRLSDPAVSDLLAAPRDIGFPSGACMLARCSALRRLGLFHEELFIYCEDLELGWRAHLAGLRVVLAPASRVRHRYTFSRGTAKYYFLERNRLLNLAACYDGKTLALLAPALLAMEAGLWAQAVTGGWWREKARAYAYHLGPGRWRSTLARRREVQGLRQVTDAEASALFTAEVIFPSVSPWLLTRVANPLFSAYWRLIRGLLR